MGTILAAFCLLILTASQPTAAGEMLASVPTKTRQAKIDWATGRELDFQCQLPLTGQWAEVPLASLLGELSQRQRISLFIDRRVDPSKLVNLSFSNLTWEQALLTVGREHGCGFARLRDIYYFGPQRSCIRIFTEYEHGRQRLSERRRKLETNWLIRRPVSWPQLSQPQELLQQFATDNGVKILKGDRITHDLWREFSAPDTDQLLRAMLLSHGFGQSIAVSQKGTRAMLLDQQDLSTAVFEVGQWEDARQAVLALKAEFPNAKFKASGKRRLRIEGNPDDVEPAIAAAVALQSPLQADQSEVRYTVELRGSRQRIIQTMATELNLQFSADVELDETLSEFIELEFRDATAEEIIEAALSDTGLKFDKTPTAIRVTR